MQVGQFVYVGTPQSDNKGFITAVNRNTLTVNVLIGTFEGRTVTFDLDADTFVQLLCEECELPFCECE